MKDRIRNLRKQKGLTQIDLANSLHITQTSVSQWETGRSYPDHELLVKLSQVLGVSVDYLLTGNNNDSTSPDATKKAPRASDLDEREALILSLTKAGILPEDRDLTDDEYNFLMGAAKGIIERDNK